MSDIFDKRFIGEIVTEEMKIKVGRWLKTFMENQHSSQLNYFITYPISLRPSQSRLFAGRSGFYRLHSDDRERRVTSENTPVYC